MKIRISYETEEELAAALGQPLQNFINQGAKLKRAGSIGHLNTRI